MGHRTGEEPVVPEFGDKQEGVNYIDHPGAYAVIQNKDKKIAVIQTGSGYFLPGGGVDPGETEMDALHRELMEETGYQISVIQESGTAVEYIKAPAEGRYYKIQSRFYQARLVSKIREGVEQDHRLTWLSREEALKLLTRQSQVWALGLSVSV